MNVKKILFFIAFFMKIIAIAVGIYAIVSILGCSHHEQSKPLVLTTPVPQAIDSVSILFEPWQQQIIYLNKSSRDSLRTVRELEYKCDSFGLLHSLTHNLKEPRTLDSILNDRYRDSLNHYLTLLWKFRKSQERMAAGLSSN